MSIVILKAGICDTIQDVGRNGYGASGINPSGAMDVFALQVANSLVANPLNAAAIEMHFRAPVLQFKTFAIIALSGADFNAEIQTDHGEKIDLPVNKTAAMQPGFKLVFNKKKYGERCYLSVSEEFNLPQWLGSYSTNLKIKEGGYSGRKLAAGDELFLYKTSASKQRNKTILPWYENVTSWYADATAFNILPGPELDWLEPDSK